MKTYTRQQNASIPSWALGYLVNGDRDGLSVDDLNTVNHWLDYWTVEADSVNGILNISPTGEQEFYTKWPEFGLPCMCAECDISIYVEEK